MSPHRCRRDGVRAVPSIDHPVLDAVRHCGMHRVVAVVALAGFGVAGASTASAAPAPKECGASVTLADGEPSPTTIDGTVKSITARRGEPSRFAIVVTTASGPRACGLWIAPARPPFRVGNRIAAKLPARRRLASRVRRADRGCVRQDPARDLGLGWGRLGGWLEGHPGQGRRGSPEPGTQSSQIGATHGTRSSCRAARRP